MRSLRWQKYDSKKKLKKIIVEIFFKKSADNRLISADKIGILDGTQSALLGVKRGRPVKKVEID